MRVTLDLDEKLLRDAQKVSGILEKKVLIHHALRTLLRLAAARELVAMGGIAGAVKLGAKKRRRR
jgi:Arc/MetJ family transcription regulator